MADSSDDLPCPVPPTTLTSCPAGTTNPRRSRVGRPSLDQAKVAVANAGGSFGELALLYNCPRAASVVASHYSVLWALDRVTFRHILEFSTRTGLEETTSSLRAVPILSGLTENQLERISSTVAAVTFDAGDHIIEKGEHGNTFYIIKSGRVTCTNVGSEYQKLENVNLGPGDYFGERALLTDEPRAANVMAASLVTCLVLDREEFTSVIGPLRDILDFNMGLRVLQSIPMFKRLLDSERDQIVKSFETGVYTRGETIVQQGDKGDRFYIIKHGACSVTQTVAGEVVEMANLGPGDYFGEIALMTDVARQANVVVTDEVVECFEMARPHFEEMLGPMKDIIARQMQVRSQELTQVRTGRK